MWELIRYFLNDSPDLADEEKEPTIIRRAIQSGGRTVTLG